jgi:hypothetical protein
MPVLFPEKFTMCTLLPVFVFKGTDTGVVSIAIIDFHSAAFALRIS